MSWRGEGIDVTGADRGQPGLPPTRTASPCAAGDALQEDSRAQAFSCRGGVSGNPVGDGGPRGRTVLSSGQSSSGKARLPAGTALSFAPTSAAESLRSPFSGADGAGRADPGAGRPAPDRAQDLPDSGADPFSSRAPDAGQDVRDSSPGRGAFRFTGLVLAPLLALLWLYRRFVSPALPPSCRYYPSCSLYAEQALVLHGPVRGLWLAFRRLLRCHPFCEGGLDPVPPREPARTPSPRSA